MISSRISDWYLLSSSNLRSWDSCSSCIRLCNFEIFPFVSWWDSFVFLRNILTWWETRERTSSSHLLARRINSLVRCRLAFQGWFIPFDSQWKGSEARTILIEFKFHDLRSSFLVINEYFFIQHQKKTWSLYEYNTRTFFVLKVAVFKGLNYTDNYNLCHAEMRTVISISVFFINRP